MSNRGTRNQPLLLLRGLTSPCRIVGIMRGHVVTGLPETRHVRTLQEAVAEAKQAVEDHLYGGPDPSRQVNRRWLSATPPHSYDDPAYAVEFLVLEGSPPKGMVIVDHSYKGRVTALAGGAWPPLGHWTVSLIPDDDAANVPAEYFE
jgi:hypothetical protein